MNYCNVVFDKTIKVVYCNDVVYKVAYKIVYWYVSLKQLVDKLAYKRKTKF